MPRALLLAFCFLSADAILRPSQAVIPDPRGFVRVEVGRNPMESGRARSLVWEGMQDLAPAPTWRELSRGTLSTVLRVVNNYLLGRISRP